MSEADNLISLWLQKSPHKTALRLINRDISWLELHSAINNVCYSLQGQGVVRGKVIAAVSKNSMELLLLYLASIKLGAVCSVIAPAPESQLLRKLDTLGCDCIWLGEGAEKALSGKAWESYRLVDLFSVTDSLDPLFSKTSQTVPVKPSVHPLQLVSIVFTSGSTGTPKAVAHTTAQHLASANGLLEVFQFESCDTWLLSLPMYHVSGLAIIWRWLTVGACLKIGANRDLFADMEGVTHASLVATQLQRLLQIQQPLSLKRVLLGGSHIPLSYAQQANAKGIETWVGYGMTEAASTVTAKKVDSYNSVGRVLPRRALKLKGEQIFIGGEILASGYFYQGKLTPIAQDGWFNSQDLGSWKNGELAILGRSDNLFISGGENIHCEEIESVLMLHPAISSAVVIAVEDKEFGARPVAVVRCDAQISLSEYRHFLKGKLEKYKWPIDYIEISAADLPCNQGTIKLPRAKIKAWFANTQQKYVLFRGSII